MLTNEQQDLLSALLNSATPRQKIWLSGFLAGIVNVPNENTELIKVRQAATNEAISADASLLVLYGSHSGNSEMVARKLSERLSSQGLTVVLQDLNDYKPRNIRKEKNIVLVVSTHGEGVPPAAADEFFEFLHGKQAPELNGLNFTVCALGDSSYRHFCKAGTDFDIQLEKLGGHRFADRVDCDLDFAPSAEKWIEAVSTYFSKLSLLNPTEVSKTKTIDGPETSREYTRDNPYEAEVLEKILLSGRGSAKENYHIELSLEGSGLQYEPGDTLGIVPRNSPELVDHLLKIKGFNPQTTVQNGFGNRTLFEALTDNLEITLLTQDVVKKYARRVKDADLAKLVADEQLLFRYLKGKDVIDLLEDFPGDLAPEQLIEVLRRLSPRLYSISSCLLANPDEVHVTVGAVRTTYRGRKRKGVCSGLLADGLATGNRVPVYISPNRNFRLPADSNAPVIMIGPGTGIAPFRAFLQQRELHPAKGKNWLFFGDRHFTTDFLYQTELQKFHRKGVLTRFDIAFSRDTDKNVYVQHRMLEKANELFAWLEEGAFIYVCGDKQRMAPDVKRALTEIVVRAGKKNQEEASDYVSGLQRSRRYMEDVY